MQFSEDSPEYESFFTQLAQLQDNCVLQERNPRRSERNLFPTVHIFDKGGKPIPRFAAYIAHSMSYADGEAFQKLYGREYTPAKLRSLATI